MSAPFSVVAGTTVRCTASFATNAGVLADPGTVTLSVRRGDGTIADISGDVVHDATGVYHADLATDDATAGNWTVQWAGSGGGPVVVDAEPFVVTRSPL